MLETQKDFILSQIAKNKAKGKQVYSGLKFDYKPSAEEVQAWLYSLGYDSIIRRKGREDYTLMVVCFN